MNSIPKILVCGGRNFFDKEFLWKTLDQICFDRKWIYLPDEYGNWLPNIILVEGGATGADTLAHDWAVSSFCPVEEYKPLKEDIAKWGYATAAKMRNQFMIDNGKPDLVVAFPGGQGTKDMVDRAMRCGLEVIEVECS